MDIFGDDDNEDEYMHLQPSELLVNRPRAADVICFHNGTEEAMFAHVRRTAEQGNPDSVIKAIDVFCYSRHWMMHIGDQKSKYLIDAIDKAKFLSKHANHALVCLELGSYCGYSTLLIAKNIPNGSKVYSVEYSPKCVEWTKTLVEFAGIADKVVVIEGSLEHNDTIFELKKNIESEYHRSDGCVGLVFIDHDKDRYLTDLLILENLSLMGSKCVVVADNILCFGNPSTDYLNHVRDPLGPYESSELYQSYVEYSVSNTTGEQQFLESQAVSRARLNNGNITTLIDGVEVSVLR